MTFLYWLRGDYMEKKQDQSRPVRNFQDRGNEVKKQAPQVKTPAKPVPKPFVTGSNG
jgi:hypothetical protein